MINRKCKIAVFLLSVSLLLISCDSIFSTPINNILENPRNYNGRSIKISGEVTEVFSLILIKYFVVKDKTGEIIVVTKRLLPRKGDMITVKGTVQEAFSIGDQQLIVIMENDKE